MGRKQVPGADALSETSSRVRQIERREWWLWCLAIIVTLLLTAGIASLALSFLHADIDAVYRGQIRESVRGLLGLVLLFDIYSVYQHYQIHSVRRQLLARDELFRVISENAADMIAVVDEDGRRIYNSPSYERVLGYSNAELENTPALDQVHPDDLAKVMHTADQARKSGQGERLEYRMRHKDGSWRILESTASVVRSASGTVNLVVVNRDITERKRVEEQLQHNAFHDALTDLPNRALFLDRLQRAFNRAKRRPEYKFAVLFLDIDDFKKVNDSLGHAAGDLLLVQLAQRLSSSLRKEDTVSRADNVGQDSTGSKDSLARFGGDEFTILIEDIHDASDAIRVATRLQKSLAASPIAAAGQEIFATASVGIALSTSPHESAEELLRDSDMAMYRAKGLGKARCEVFDARLHVHAVKRLDLENQLRKALEHEEFRAHYQPIVRLADMKIAGFEALIRWERPNIGLVPPAEFITVAEECGLIVPINRWLRLEACRRTRVWQMQFPTLTPLTLSLNVTARELAHSELVSDIRQALDETGLTASSLRLEVVETIAMRDSAKPESILTQLKRLGVHLSIDDFGTGYSSLSRLRNFPADTLKIDRSFISHIDTDSANLAFARTIVALGHNLDLAIVAEGAETLGEVNCLLNVGCDYVQGYVFSRPVDAESITDLLKASHFGKTTFTLSQKLEQNLPKISPEQSRTTPAIRK